MQDKSPRTCPICNESLWQLGKNGWLVCPKGHGKLIPPDGVVRGTDETIEQRSVSDILQAWKGAKL